jgi:hypothetical protein
VSKIAIALAAISISSAATAEESWTCSYHGFGTDKMVSLKLVTNGNKLNDGTFGIANKWDILDNNQYALIAAYHYAKFDTFVGAVRVEASMIMIDKTFGEFVYMVADLGDQPGYRTGSCRKD